jgi:renalase
MIARSCLIIGAGIAGLSAAYHLVKAGWVVQLVDKGLGIGGRIATRRMGQAVFDHGAQFFSIRDTRFGDLISPMLHDGTVREWSKGFPSLTVNGKRSQTGELSSYSRYCGATGMTAIPKHLARGLNIQLGRQVVAISRHRSSWQTMLDNKEHYVSNSVILTPPLPQSLALLETSHITLPGREHRTLSSISFDPCLALLVVLDNPSKVPPPGAIQVNGEKLAWIADNYQKDISPTVAMTLHATPEFSRLLWDHEETTIARQLLEAAQEWLGSAVREHQLKRWRYSRPTSTHHADCLMVESNPPLILAGDAFGGPRIEGAALSGLAAAELLCS